MKVLIVSANPLPAAPTGPAYVAGAALAAGHEVEIYEYLFAEEGANELEEQLGRFDPDVVGISIRVVTGDSPNEDAAFYTADGMELNFPIVIGKRTFP